MDPHEHGNAALSRLGRAVGDPSRVAMLLTLFDRPNAPLKVLADVAQIAPSTASAHLDVLLDAGLVERRRVGRCVEVSLAGPEAAHLVEQLMSFANSAPMGMHTTKMARLRVARTCYDHLAGRLGVSVTDCLVSTEVLDHNLVPTPQGLTWLNQYLGLDPKTFADATAARPLVRSCLDWTERRPHVAGRLGAAVCAAFIAHAWVAQRPEERSLRVTPTGQRFLSGLGICLDQ